MIEYTCIFENGDLITWCILDETDFVEVHRIPNARQGDEDDCLECISASQRAAEEHAGELLPWVVPTNDNDRRACWTTPIREVAKHDRIPS